MPSTPSLPSHSLHLFHTFSLNFQQLLERDRNHDVKITVGKAPNVKEFKAHSLILRTQSPYFYAALSTEWVKMDDGMIVFEKPNVAPNIFEVILRYLYTGTIVLSQTTPEALLSLLVAADELMLPEFISHIEDHLVSHESDWLEAHFDSVFTRSFKHASWIKLQEFCLENLCDQSEGLLSSEKFFNFDEDVVVGLLKRDDFVVEEVAIWESLLAWAKRRCGREGENDHRWSEEEIKMLAKWIGKSVPHVRFFRMSIDDLYSKVRPFISIIPRDVYESALWYHLKPTHLDLALSPRGDAIDSKLLKLKHAAIITSWIDRRSNAYSYGQIPYKFRLLVRGTRDGFTSSVFHARCQSALSTIVLMRVAGTNELLGGYNPSNWYPPSTGSYWKSTPHSFIFSFADSRNVKTAKISRVHPGHVSGALYVNGSNGPDFGNSDLRMLDNYDLGRCSCARYRYEVSIREESSPFRVDEYEVFQVSRK
ncbi:659_t:CDS:2 [Paraglomus occultum]|uniref:659_t:CDS:1 n=1 Tax=Paraglomus occultum TaxID=144539 RepID=A0A9N8VR34_9GLOM|nr:659_t:CDS:2 [Paraglomus occultum]